ncbi:hypothetical protein TIFTF001_032454 [Ficus carica]|uniref:Uncharacterized protein n=1 Tax=Ficus carica TaxID=3494 RepID=A0AA88DX48_FICCA|nr:hypothetical protein TIFTF001_032454 [Ficus carica]
MIQKSSHDHSSLKNCWPLHSGTIAQALRCACMEHELSLANLHHSVVCTAEQVADNLELTSVGER